MWKDISAKSQVPLIDLTDGYNALQTEVFTRRWTPVA